jgi:hypothetical protein
MVIVPQRTRAVVPQWIRVVPQRTRVVVPQRTRGVPYQTHGGTVSPGGRLLRTGS